MACKDCFNNCGSSYTLDKCVEYTGEDIELLKICKGDPLSKVEQALIDNLLTALDGTGIVPKDVTLENAPTLLKALGTKDPNLNNILQILINENKSLREVVTQLSNVDIFVFDKACLTGLPTVPNSDQILQAAVKKICILNTIIDAFSATYVKTTDIEGIIKNVTSPAQTIISYYKNCVPFTAYEYYGPLSNFDNTGKGLSSTGFDKLYLCNGLNGTPDKRGRVTAGAVRNVPGGALDANVDPANALNPNANYGLKDKFGSNYQTLDVSQIPNHTHDVIDPGHTHDFPGQKYSNHPGGASNNEYRDPAKQVTDKAPTGISIGSTGGGQPHENRQPSIAAYYYMYIP